MFNGLALKKCRREELFIYKFFMEIENFLLSKSCYDDLSGKSLKTRLSNIHLISIIALKTNKITWSFAFQSYKGTKNERLFQRSS